VLQLGRNGAGGPRVLGYGFRPLDTWDVCVSSPTKVLRLGTFVKPQVNAETWSLMGQD
jgi:hypothetical protein